MHPLALRMPVTLADAMIFSTGLGIAAWQAQIDLAMRMACASARMGGMGGLPFVRPLCARSAAEAAEAAAEVLRKPRGRTGGPIRRPEPVNTSARPLAIPAE
ncbi:MAG: hypothetical protein ACK4KW_08625 [Gemmobacter sp.]